jgi:hypothetical protein
MFSIDRHFESTYSLCKTDVLLWHAVRRCSDDDDGKEEVSEDVAVVRSTISLVLRRRYDWPVAA